MVLFGTGEEYIRLRWLSARRMISIVTDDGSENNLTMIDFNPDILYYARMSNYSRTGYKIVILLAMLTLWLLLAGGCTKEQDSEYDPYQDPLVNPAEMFETPPADRSLIAENESFVLTFRSGPNTLNPLFVSTTYDALAQVLVFDRLFHTDNDLNVFANPAVVESWSESDDHLVITVKIRADLKWQDGTKLTAGDFAFAMEALKSDSVPCYTYKTEVQNISQVEVVDDYTLIYTLARPLATRLDLISYPYAPLPKHIYGKPEEMAANPDLKSGSYYEKLALSPVGNGPYKLIEWVENDKMVFERWEEYPGPRPYLKQIIFRFQPDVSMSLRSFKNGDTDSLYTISSKQCAQETNDEGFASVGRKYVMPEWMYSYYGWNMDGTNPFFIDRKVRYAMAHSYNFELIKSKLAYNMVTKCAGIFHPTSWMFNDNIVLLDYDLEEAAKLLDEAGWLLAEDGWRYKSVNYVLVERPRLRSGSENKTEIKKIFLTDEQDYIPGEKEIILEEGVEHRKFVFTLLAPNSIGIPSAAVTIFQTDLQKIGVEMKVRLMEWTSFLESIRQHDMQAWTAAWGAGTDPDGSKGAFLTEDYIAGRNYGGYSNLEVDELFNLAMVEFDRDKRAEYYQQIQELIYNDQPYLFDYNPLSATIIHKRFRGLEKGNFGFCNTYPGFFNLWVPKGQELRPVKSE